MISRRVGVADASALYAAVGEDEPSYERTAAVLARPDLHLIIPAMCLAEATYLIAGRRGPRVEAAFLRGLVDYEIIAPTAVDLARMADLVDQYADLPLGAADASIVALAERLGTDTIITLDHRRLSVVRPRHVERLRLLPD